MPLNPSFLGDQIIVFFDNYFYQKKKNFKISYVCKQLFDTYWWFAFDVMAAMLEVQHKGICY